MTVKRLALLVLATAACGLVAMVAVRQLQPRAPRVDVADATVPAHYFTAAGRDVGDVLGCRLTAFASSPWEIWGRPPQPCTAVRGWTGANSWGTWAFGASSAVTFWLDETDWERMTVRARAYDGLPDEALQTLRIELPGFTSDPVAVPAHWARLTFDIAPGALRAGANEVVLRFAHRTSPAAAGRGKDELPLAAAVEEISLSRSGAGGDGRAGAAPGQVFDRGSGRFRIDRSGTLVVPAVVPPDTSEIEVELEVEAGGAAARRGAKIEIAVADVDGRRTERDAFEVATSRLTGAARTVRRRIPAEGLAGATCLITIAVDLAEGATIAVTPPRFEPGLPAAEPAQPAGEAGRRPDIVVITLDAARSDHFSCYGYHRPTTPAIDRFAADALVFEHAFALAPYTLCSVPTMITGLSFFDHGVTSHDSTLSEQATTLAEHLRAAGYRTACFSATPNNSSAKGFDQGYDQFVELWREVSQARARQPHYVTDRVTEWLRTLDEDRPLHLQVHYIPPHGPYVPEPRFDRFTDPSYDGACQGVFKTLTALEVGDLDPGQGCLEEVIGLYDGNLLNVDHAVGELLEALQRRERWRDTVLLITADHGEAFLEHGRMHHNSTVFDEMLRVPFILRVPDWIDAGTVDLGRMVTLADIVPTMLAAAALRPSSRLEGVDLLARSAGSPQTRTVIACNTDKPPLLGLRTARWKAILSPTGHGALYDLERDPGELDNLVFTDRSTFAGLGLLLTQRATAPRTLETSAERAAITEQDREMLRALGYVDGDE